MTWEQVFLDRQGSESSQFSFKSGQPHKFLAYWNYFILYLMCERKAWTQQEDQLLIQIMKENSENENGKKMKWNQIALKISELSKNKYRKGKQCRQRWFNQLHPDISKEAEWTAAQETLLFELQQLHGNRWAKIAKEMAGRSDNNIKNYFYSTLRKALRRVNNHVAFNKQVVLFKNMKAFQSNTLNKILAVAENKAHKKIIVGKQSAWSLAKDLKKSLIHIQVHLTEKDILEETDFMKSLVSKIQDFNRVCKRKKSKKRDVAESEQQSVENIQASLDHNHIDNFEQEEEEVSEGLKFEQNSLPQKSTIKQQDLSDHQQICQNQMKEEQPLSPKSSTLAHSSLPKNLVQPIISSCTTSNSISHSTRNNGNREEATSKEEISSQSLEEEYPFIHNEHGVSYVSFFPQEIFNATSFRPTTIYANPYMGMGQNQSNSMKDNPSNYWRQTYSLHQTFPYSFYGTTNFFSNQANPYLVQSETK